ncbi:hypothetical protein [Pedobacter sp. SYSU D00535]|uniref:hypothetical protein n=1 Tax=Pedobacter sp. SYSU D00535 TaxID=2810308 RepID=UPI001A95F5C3|nr:hypothetical protein [Pedobacter sp. SYSU D00535]
MKACLLLFMLFCAAPIHAQEQERFKTTKALIDDLPPDTDLTEKVELATETDGRHILAARKGISLVAVVAGGKVRKYEAYNESGEKLAVEQESQGQRLYLCVKDKSAEKVCWNTLRKAEKRN